MPSAATTATAAAADTQPAGTWRRGAVNAVHSVDRFVFTVPDLAEAERFYRTFGLDVRRETSPHREALSLRTFGNPHVWGLIHQAPGIKQLQYVSFGIFEEDEPVFAERIRQRGIGIDAHPLGEARGLWLRGPDGLAIQLVVAEKVAPSRKTVPAVNIVKPGAGAAPARSKVAQVRPRYLSHILLFTADVTAALKFYGEVLGLRLSDRSRDIVAFMHGAHGSDHHLVAFAKSSGGGLHHTSWDVGSIHDVGQGIEQLRSAGYEQGWGLGRHVLGSNYFYYARDPWGSYAEYSFDIDFVPHDLDWPAADHAPEDSFYVWGPQPPADFVTNHEHPAAG